MRQGSRAARSCKLRCDRYMSTSAANPPQHPPPGHRVTRTKESATAAGRRVFHQMSHGVWVWTKDRTLGASWLPPRLRRPWSGILIGLALIGVIFIAVPLLRSEFSSVPLKTLLLFLAIVLTAVMWGTVPSLVVTLVGIVVLDHIQWYPNPAL